MVKQNADIFVVFGTASIHDGLMIYLFGHILGSSICICIYNIFVIGII